ncbi:MAG TPA: PEP/pyruvate-binding domain-containing protein, partial [Thermoplasmata archaeon]|nr:PEP/pyruvate-binding domain-containing protein [Thermoplasmata archaeon]
MTTDAFARFVIENNCQGDVSTDDLKNAKFPRDVSATLDPILSGLGGAALAVRSSATGEDLPGASFAGQFETVLGVRERSELEAAILECWKSAFANRVKAYAERRGSTDETRMAVLIQRLVPARAAGVAFTANPVTGNRDEVVINAVRGLGDKLVSGETTPDEWVFRNDTAIRRSSPQDALTASDAESVARLAKRVEAFFGVPQDIEWAIGDQELFLLQARPITTLAPIQIEVPVHPPTEGFWQQDTAHFPKPISPMYRSYKLPIMKKAMSEIGEEFGLLLEGIDTKEIGGWDYARFIPFGGKDRDPPPVWLIRLLIRLVPSLRKRIKRQIEVVRGGLSSEYARRWEREWKPELIRRSTALLAIGLGGLSDKELDVHLTEVLEFVTYASAVHFRYMAVPGILPLGQLVLEARELLGWDEGRTLGLVTGLSETVSEPGLKMRELIRAIEADPALREIVDHPTPDALARIEAASPPFFHQFQMYCAAYGNRALSYEVCDPTLSERPDLLLGLIRSQMSATGVDPTTATSQRRQELEREAVARLKDHPENLRRFQTVVEAARLTYPTVDDNTLYTQNLGDALARYVLLEIGRRLSERRLLTNPDDVFFLTLDEARKSLSTKEDFRGAASRRRAERACALAHPGPPSYGKAPPGPPPLDGLPLEAKLMTQVLLWASASVSSPMSMASMSSGPSEATSDRQLRGVPASSGLYTGPARIVRDETEFDKLRPGDVLVCPTTTPVWSVLFPNAGALVTEA